MQPNAVAPAGFQRSHLPVAGDDGVVVRAAEQREHRQVGHTGPLRPSETGRPIPYIDQVALDFPELAIVCGHVGYPWTEEMVAVARKHENVYIDTSAYTIKRLPQELIGFMKTGTGQRKVLFGTNYPMMSHAHALAGFDELGLGGEARRDFLHGNAERVFGLAN